MRVPQPDRLLRKRLKAFRRKFGRDPLPGELVLLHPNMDAPAARRHQDHPSADAAPPGRPETPNADNVSARVTSDFDPFPPARTVITDIGPPDEIRRSDAEAKEAVTSTIIPPKT